MAMDVKRVVSGAVSSALSRLTSNQRLLAESTGNSDEDDFKCLHTTKRGTGSYSKIYRVSNLRVKLCLLTLIRKTTMPSSFLTRHEARVNKKKTSGKDFVYDRDIACIPKRSGTSTIKIPRSKDVREMLGHNGLIGKIRLTLSMSEGQIMDEIKSVFRKPMKGKADFAFKILQPSGGSSKTLSILHYPLS